jgi:hypothetical protein
MYADYFGLGDRGWWAIPLIVVQAPLLLSAHSVLLAWVYNHTSGSMLLCVLYHFAISSSAFIFAVDYPSDASFLFWSIISALVWWAVAGAIVVAERRQPRRSTRLRAV